MTQPPAPLASPSRRRLLTGLAAGLVLPCVPGWAAEPGFWDRPRWLDVVRQRTGERVKAVYWANGRVNPEGYTAVCRALRDVRAGVTVAMDPRLLDLMCAMQAWVGHYGFNDPITVLSGYRTPHTNATTEGAARHSMHMRAQAADVVFEGLPVSYVGQLAQRYAGGGVGFYPSNGFVHVDTGSIRTWRKG